MTKIWIKSNTAAGHEFTVLKVSGRQDPEKMLVELLSAEKLFVLMKGKVTVKVQISQDKVSSLWIYLAHKHKV